MVFLMILCLTVVPFSPPISGPNSADSWESVEISPPLFTLKLMASPNVSTNLWNSISVASSTIAKTIGLLGFRLLNLPTTATITSPLVLLRSN